MKLIIAGSRTSDNYLDLLRALDSSGFRKKISEVVSGCAAGADRMGERYADENNIPIKKFPAHWERDGKSAGPLRNIEMANYADALLALWDGQSRGTKHMIDVATKQGLNVYIWRTQ